MSDRPFLLDMLVRGSNTRFGQYLTGGVYETLGATPTGVTRAGVPQMQLFNTALELRGNTRPLPYMVGQIAASGSQKWINGLTSLGTIGLGAGNILLGFQEDGLGGAWDAAVFDLAVGSAIQRFAYGSVGSSGASANIGFLDRARQVGVKAAGTTVAFGGGGGIKMGMMRSAGAVGGAMLGQSLLGAPGAFIGSYVGAAPIRFAATHPLLAGGMIAGAAAATVGYGAYSMVKSTVQEGYAHRQRQRGVHTSGSMAAFMTQGAMTMRGRAVQAMHKSHMNARSALGQEAGFMHLPSKNYHSRYR